MQAYPMYGPIGAPFQKEANSPKGVRWCTVAFAIYLGVLVAQVAYGAWGAVNFDSLAMNSYYNYSASFLTFAFIAVTSILEILVLVFYLIGFGYLYGGRNEFSPNHTRHVNIAMGLVIAAIATAFVGSIITMSLQFQNLFSYYSHPDPGTYYAIVAAGAVMNTLVAAFIAMAIVLPVHGLVDQRYDRYLYLAAGLGTATPGIVSAFTFWQLPRVIDALSDGYYSFSTINTSTGCPTLVAGALGLVTFVVFIMLYWNVSTRIRGGQLKPIRPQVSPSPVVWIPIQVVPMVPPYPMYPPYAPAQPVVPQQPVPPPEPGKQGSAQQTEQKTQ